MKDVLSIWQLPPICEDNDYNDVLIPVETAEPSAPVTGPETPSSPPIESSHDLENEIVPPAGIRPSSPATDPDPSKTVYCSVPYKAGVPIVQYALMVDAGSTGSRIHIYKFNNCRASPMYEYEVFKPTHRALSIGQPLDAAESLDVLLDEAAKVVPSHLQNCTPVAVKASAGFRLLGAADGEDILEAVRQRLTEKYPFNVVEVAFIDGKDQGLFTWITANYLLKTLRDNSPADTSTYAVMMVAAGSTQIVFKPVFNLTMPENTIEESKYKHTLTFGGQTHVLFQQSYIHLGYGLMRLRRSVHHLVDSMSTILHNTDDGTVANPCLAQGTHHIVDVDGKPRRNVNMSGSDVGSFETCNRIVELVMAKDA